MAKKIEFKADKVKISGPRVDESFVITFETGDYAWDDIKDLPKLNGKIIKVEVSGDE